METEVAGDEEGLGTEVITRLDELSMVGESADAGGRGMSTKRWRGRSRHDKGVLLSYKVKHVHETLHP